MSPNALFSLASSAAALAWLLLISSLLVQGWASAPGGFSSLADVAALFTVPGMVLAGWEHYLAFDLWVGRWQIDALAGWCICLSSPA